MSTEADTDRLRQAVQTIRRLNAEVESLKRGRSEPVAVVGIGCRYPGGADSPDALWELLLAGRDAVGDVPPDRWDVPAYFDPDPAAVGKMYTRRGSYLPSVEGFDPDFFGIAPREAVGLDPQHRLVLETAWEALEHGGIPPGSLAGSRTGVYVGINSNEYYQMALHPGRAATVDAYAVSGAVPSMAAGRLSYVLGVHGPSLAVDTACSSSLVAVHLAVQALRRGECDIAIAAGVYLVLRPELGIGLCKLKMLAPDGRCKTFDAAADGFALGEGCGTVVLKRLADATRDGDRVLAVVRGSAVNQDGRSAGLTAPNGPAQEAVIRAALNDAGLEPTAIDYVEAHGTGTALGDPIELRALSAVLGAGRSKEQPLRVGSVKTNLGHTGPAAGITGFIKLVLALYRETIPPHLNLREPNRLIPWAEMPLTVPTVPTPWPVGNRPRVGAVSAFGFSGTNAHVVVCEAPARGETTAPERPARVLPLSARDPETLRELARRYATLLRTTPDTELADVCHTAAAGRSHFAERLAVVVRTSAEAAEALTAYAEGRASNVTTGSADPALPPTVALVFPGECPADVSDLIATCPAFRSAFEQSAKWFDPAAQSTDGPKLFRLQHAFAELWRAWGVSPDVVVGMGAGALAAACVAGAVRWEDAARVLDPPTRAPLTGVRPQVRLTVVGSPQVAAFPGVEAREPGSPLTESCDIALSLGAGVVQQLGRPGARQLAGACDLGGLLRSVAALYLRGVKVNWAGFDRGHARRKVSLPTYPFRRKRYWREDFATAPEPSATAAADPLLGVRVPSPLRDVQFAATVGIDAAPYLQDHRVFEQVVLPGAGYLSMAVAAGSRVLGPGPVALEGVTFPTALVLRAGDRRAVQTVLSPAGEAWEFAVHSQADGGSWAKHAGGRVRSCEAEAPIGTADATGGDHWTEEWNATGWAEKLVRSGVQIGPLFRGLVRVRRRDGLACGDVRVPEPLREAAARSPFHPALLDSCLQLLGAAFPDGGPRGSYLPVGLDRFRWYRRPEGELRCRATLRPPSGYGDTLSGDIVIADRAGTVAMVEGLTARRVTPEGLRPGRARGDRLYRIQWRPAPREDSRSSVSGSYLVLGDGPTAADLTRRLAESGVEVRQGEAEDPGRFRHVVFVAEWGDGEHLNLDGCRSLLRVSQTLGTARLWVVTRGSQAVGGVAPDVASAAVWGLAGVVASEFPASRCIRIDLDPGDNSTELLFRELSDSTGDDQIAFRGGERCVPRLETMEAGDLTPRPPSLARKGEQEQDTWSSAPLALGEGRRAKRAGWGLEIPQKGTYLVTGGLTGLGLEAATWLVETGARHLTLVGRRGPSPGTAERLREWERRGVSLRVISADVSQFAEVARVLAEIDAGGVPLRGVVHSAGVLDDGVLAGQTWERFERVLAPKLDGAWHLHRLTREMPLDLFVLFGSVASFVGAAGGGNYAAANAGLAALAEHRRACGLPALCIDWGPWATVGMAADAGDRVAKRIASLGLPAIDPAAGRLALADAVRHGLPRVAALPGVDWGKFTTQFPPDAVPQLFVDLVPRVASSDPAADRLQAFREAAPEVRSTRLLAYVAAASARVLGREDDNLDTRRSLTELGLDSLMAIELRNRLRTDLGADVPLDLLFQPLPVERLCEALLARSAPANAAGEGWEVLEI